MSMTDTPAQAPLPRTLDELETVIERGRQTFVEVGQALLEVRDRRLYREAGHGSFEDYLRQRWGWHRRHGYELIDAARVFTTVRSNAHPEAALPSLTQAVQLASLPDEDQRTLATEVDFGQTTVRELRELVRERKDTKSHAQAHAERLAAVAGAVTQPARHASAPGVLAMAETVPTRLASGSWWGASDLAVALPSGALHGHIVRAHAGDYTGAMAVAGVLAHVCVTSFPYWAKRQYTDRGDGSGLPLAEEFGQEARPEEYVERAADFVRAILRALDPQGVLFLVLGDTYASQPGRYRGDPERRRGVSRRAVEANGTAMAGRDLSGLAPKTKVGIPARVEVALIEAGWRVLNVVPWFKPNHQPENVHDRLTTSWDPILLVTAAEHCYLDRDAVTGLHDGFGHSVRPHDHLICCAGRGGRANGHPAPFHEDVVEWAIRLGCPPGGTVLDPFAGSGTTRDVADRMGRRFLGCDLQGEPAAPGDGAPS